MKDAKNKGQFAISVFFALAAIICASVDKSKAQIAENEICAEAKYSVIARNSAGEFIPNIAVEVFEQIEDADYRPKPGLKVASGKTSVISGKFSGIIKKPEGKKYAIKMNSLGKDASAFWFYNKLELSCGDVAEASETLSAVEFIIRDAKGALKRNEQFSIYLQKYDVDGKPIREKSSLLASLNTGGSGKAVAYVPSGANHIDGNGSGYYVLEKAGINGGYYSQYDILASERNTTRVEYRLSKIKLELKNSSGKPFPANSKVEIFTQKKDEDDDPVVGEKIKDLYTDDAGIILFEYPAGIYAIRLAGSGSSLQYFWNLAIKDHEQTVYSLKTGADWLPDGGACEAVSNFSLFLSDFEGNAISGLNFNLFEQNTDADGRAYSGKKLGGGVVDAEGEGMISVNPDPRNKYALQIFEKNEKIGDFWYYDSIQFACGQNIQAVKKIPALTIVLRGKNGGLLKNQIFSIYAQKFDADNKPTKEKSDLVYGKYTSGETGMITLFLAPDHAYRKDKRGTYLLMTSNADKAVFSEYGIKISSTHNQVFEYAFSELIINYRNAGTGYVAGKAIDIYEQDKNANNQNILGKKIKTLACDAYGAARFEYPAGTYAAIVSDGAGQKNIFWGLEIRNRAKSEIDLVENLIEVSINDAFRKAPGKTPQVSVSVLKEGANGYVVDKKIKSLNAKTGGALSISLAPGAYLFSVLNQKIEYGKALYVQNGEKYALEIRLTPGDKIENGRVFKFAGSESVSLAEKLKGRLLLQVEGRGEAWYVDPVSRKRYYVKDGSSAYEILRKFGLGTANADLAKIPIGLDARFEEWDYDGDLVSDKMEESIGTDMYDYDSDGDSFNDGQELMSGYDPLGSGKVAIDKNFARRLSGKILLQTESRGEAWYVNPADNRRYYLKDGESAYEIMRFLSLGVTNANLNKIEKGE